MSKKSVLTNRIAVSGLCTFAGIAIAGLCAFAGIAFARINPNGGSVKLSSDSVSIDFPAAATTVISKDGRPDKAIVLLSASDLWAPSGLVLKPGQTLKTRATGRANLAIHRLVDAAMQDTVPTTGWVNPAGEQNALVVVNNGFNPHLNILPQEPVGSLLACLHKEGEPEPSVTNPRPPRIVAVGADGTIKNEYEETMSVWFVVNDAVLNNSRTAKLAYLGGDSGLLTANKRPIGYKYYNASNAASWTKAEHWEYIQKYLYWRIWFDDNVGYYHIQCDFQPNG